MPKQRWVRRSLQAGSDREGDRVAQLQRPFRRRTPVRRLGPGHGREFLRHNPAGRRGRMRLVLRLWNCFQAGQNRQGDRALSLPVWCDRGRDTTWRGTPRTVPDGR